MRTSDGGAARVAVLVLTHGRDEHLLRQQAALALEPGWDEAVVCFVDQRVEPWNEAPRGVRTVHVGERAPINLGAARNAAARATGAQVLVFLDVDCIPAPEAIAVLAAECEPGRLVMADPRYLPPSWDPDAPAEPQALAHPARRELGYGAGAQWHMFWSLGFAIRADDFAAVGGFDEGYQGYGGEDTDVAFRCRDAGMELWWSRARVCHQPHAVHRPPLQHLDSIVVNARRFRRRWGVWPMTGWLAEFARRGYVTWDEESLTVVRRPDEAQVAATRIDAAFG